MRLLLDSSTFLRMVGGRPLGDEATKAILDQANELYLSAASYWEISIKLSLGKLVLAENWPDLLDQEMAANAIHWLPITAEHCQALVILPFIHRDPFDRLLIAQAQSDTMSIVTSDGHIRKYAVSTIW